MEGAGGFQGYNTPSPHPLEHLKKNPKIILIQTTIFQIIICQLNIKL